MSPILENEQRLVRAPKDSFYASCPPELRRRPLSVRYVARYHTTLPASNSSPSIFQPNFCTDINELKSVFIRRFPISINWKSTNDQLVDDALSFANDPIVR